MTVTMTKTMIVATIVSRRDGHVTRRISLRTSLTNLAGDLLTILTDPYTGKHEKGAPISVKEFLFFDFTNATSK